MKSSEQNNNEYSLVLIGGGGHASVLADILKNQNREIEAMISVEGKSERGVFESIPNYVHDREIARFSPKSVKLVMGIGIMPYSKSRKSLIKHFESLGYVFETVISNNAYVSPYATLQPGAQILTNAVVHAGSVIGSHSIVNTGAIIEHDCEIGLGCHIAPNATLCGQVKCNEDVFVGAGAIVLGNLFLESSSIAGAGTIISRNLNNSEIARN